ncbi:Plant peroxidase [Macleaya cordata]|uniref:Peroxidase n=1 Tax=Macleaya cordata TaxID=56857 RepID=A0A200QPZ8_MACCD|nr:Plant peroxidase [Macleaya cordata]
MKSTNSSLNLLLVSLLFFGVFAAVCQGDNLRKNFYKHSCYGVEKLVWNITRTHVLQNPQLPAKLLRLHFHDCFVRGCDASLLLNSTAKFTAEKDSPPNVFLAGFDVIEDIKAKLEKICPKTVSCADILALATRDAVSFQLQRPLWKVLTGRRDGRVSLASEVLTNIPNPASNFTVLKQNFAKKGLTVQDLVVLSGGGHTIGVGHCFLFANRLYNFTGKGDADPSLDPTYAAFLRKKCSPTDTTTTVEMDPGSSLKFDNNYYVNLKKNRGLFTSDATLLTNKFSRKLVYELLDSEDFFTEFSQAMKRLNSVGVLTGKAGEIRKKCSVVN